MNRLQTGNTGEIYVQQKLSELGYTAVIEYHAGYDILAYNEHDAVLIEVKTSHRTSDGKYRATTIKEGQFGSTDHRKSDIIIFVCIDESEQYHSFVIPSDEHGDKRQIVIGAKNPQNYNGKYAQYYEAWEIFM